MACNGLRASWTRLYAPLEPRVATPTIGYSTTTAICPEVGTSRRLATHLRVNSTKILTSSWSGAATGSGGGGSTAVAAWLQQQENPEGVGLGRAAAGATSGSAT